MSDFITAEMELEALEMEATEIMALQDEMDVIGEVRMGLETFGTTKTAIMLMQTTGLISGTVLDGIALEGFSDGRGLDEETALALEALDNKVSEKSATWSAKLVTMAKSVGSKILAVIEPIWNKLSELFGKLASKTWDAAKSVGRSVRAHPFKTVILLVAAIAAVAGILAYCGSFLPGSNQGWSALGKFDKKLSEMASKIKLPFGGAVKTAAGSAKNPNLIDVVFAPRRAENIPIEKLGWTQGAAKSCYTQLSSAMTSLKGGLGAFAARAGKVFTGNVQPMIQKSVGAVEGVYRGVGGAVYNATGSRTVAGAAQMVASGAFFWGAVNIFHKIYRLVRKIVIGGLKMIWSTVRALFDFS